MQAVEMSCPFDYALVGGGLQCGLVALALLDADPSLRISLVERADRLGGNHTWCFHEADVPPSVARAIAPLVVHRWDRHEVRFPGARRVLPGRYCAVTSARLDEVVRARVGARGGEVALGRAAVRVAATEVELDDGSTRAARFVVDARGDAGAPPPDARPPRTCGYQVFLGREVVLARPHGIAHPILMDADVEQIGGFRFVYVLPLAADRLLLEDTTFADAPTLDEAALRDRLDAYAIARGFVVDRVAREERGVLPMPWTGGARPRATWPLDAGYRGGFFHPATGYSFPLAARLAAALASAPRAGGGDAVAQLCDALDGPLRFARTLNGLAFRWYGPAERWRVFEHFYRLPQPVIERFYALAPTAIDQARVFFRGPPKGLSLRARLGAWGAA